MLPSFFVVGPQRTGTSWLHEVLKSRATLPAFTKETRFFDVHFHEGVRWYQAHFGELESVRTIGEIAPTYFASRRARQRMRELVPQAKIVCIFRDPVERLVSFYRLKRAYGLLSWSFDEAILRDEEMAESSMYATHFAEWMRAFGPEQVLPLFYDDLRDRPQFFVDQLAQFVGIPHFVLGAAETAVVHSSKGMTVPRASRGTRYATLFAEWLKAKRFGALVAALKASPLGKALLGGGRQLGELSPEAALRAYDLFREEIERLELMVGRDLSAWKWPASLVDSNSLNSADGCFQSAD